jgi:polyisoprenyl-phosphate glycosyltransferase
VAANPFSCFPHLFRISSFGFRICLGNLATATAARYNITTPVKAIETDVLIVIPVYNDWEAVSVLLPLLDTALSGASGRCAALLVNDGSQVEPPAELLARKLGRLGTPLLLDLRRNLGHQRAIAVALAWVCENAACRSVVVMDGDGEDNPADVPRLLQALDAGGGRQMVFAERTRRSESWVFRFFYNLYKLIHVVLTGKKVRVGNFSVLPFFAVEHLAVTPEMWSHYAAAALRSRIPVAMVPSERKPRYTGTSKMNFTALTVHGLAAISTYGDVIGVRLLMTSLFLLAAVAAALGVVSAIALNSPMALPGWMPLGAGLLLLILFQAAVLAIMFIFIILSGSRGSPFLPLREYRLFVRGLRGAA